MFSALSKALRLAFVRSIAHRIFVIVVTAIFLPLIEAGLDSVWPTTQRHDKESLRIPRQHGVHALDERVKFVHVHLQELFGRRRGHVSIVGDQSWSELN